MSKLTFSAVEAAVATAMAAPEKGVRQVADNCSLRTVVYTSAKGAGVEVRATVMAAGVAVTLVRQRGPEVFREVAPPDFAVLQAKAFSKAQAEYDEAVANGIVVNGTTFGARDGDRAAFNQLLTLLREAEELEPDDPAKTAFRASVRTVADKAGAPHQMTVDQIRSAMVQYGQVINGLWAALVTTKAAVSAATTLDELAVI